MRVARRQVFWIFLILGGPAFPGLSQVNSLGDEATRQLAVYNRIIESLTPTERKIDIAFIMERMYRQRDPLRAQLPKWNAEIRYETDGRIVVDIAVVDRETIDNGNLVRDIELLGGTLKREWHSSQYTLLRAALPLQAVWELVSRAEVTGITRPLNFRPREKNFSGSSKLNTTFVSGHSAETVNRSEGDVAHGADLVRDTMGIDGSGILACVLSDGVDSLAAVQASGDLPPGVTVLPGLAGLGDEGTAMLEIIHDLARGAELVFATAGASPDEAAAAIDALSSAGCNVIAIDIFFDPPIGAFYPDAFEERIHTLSEQGLFSFTSAGNIGHLSADTSGVWEGDYVPDIRPAGNFHDFSDTGDIRNEILEDATVYSLIWSDPRGGVTEDFDIQLWDGPSLVTTGIPFLDTATKFIVDSSDNVGLDIVVRKTAGSFLRYIRVTASPQGRTEHQTEGAITHALGAERAFTVAAVDATTAGGGLFAGGGGNPVQDFSADGRRRLFYEVDGTPITPGDLLETGGREVDKPDFAAADNVSTATPGFSSFGGTSAASAHAAAIAALVLEAQPTLTRDELMNVLTNASLDIEGAGWDVDSGAGILRADLAVSAFVVFADGFESGDTTSWSSTVP